VRSYRNEFNTNGTLRSHSIQGPVADNATYDLLGFYVQDEIDFHPRLKGTLGVRYTHAWADANEIEDPQTGRQIRFSDNWGSFVGNANLIATVHENLNLYAGASQGFRSPNLSDLTRLDNARSGEIETPSPGGQGFPLAGSPVRTFHIAGERGRVCRKRDRHPARCDGA
jgi:hemoglobin/transferrin/lactoferrin receptor protein